MVEKTQSQSFFFIQISDPQFGMLPVNGSAFRETPLFEKAIAHANRLAPAFVLNTGDLVNNPLDEKQLDEALGITQKLNRTIALYTVPGNHDIGDSPTEETLQWYRRRIGKDWYSFDYGGWHFIGLNSCIITHGECVPLEARKQWDWLNHDLEQAAARNNAPIIVFMHHPLFLNDPEEPDDYFNVPGRIRQVYMNLLCKYGVKTVLAGHLHQNSLGKDSSLEVITTAPVGMPLGNATSGLRIVKVLSDRIEHKYFSLDDKISQDF